VRIAVGEGQEQGDGASQGGDLGEREVDEDHPPFDHVDAEVGVDAGDDEGGREGGGEELQDGGVHEAISPRL
jgi:hypothetical protein